MNGREIKNLKYDSDDLGLPADWHFWIHARMEKVDDHESVPMIDVDVCDTLSQTQMTVEMDDSVEVVTSSPVHLNRFILDGDPVETFLDVLVEKIGEGATLSIHRAEKGWRLELDTNVGYASQATVESFPWE